MNHYDDVIMSLIASQITSLTIVYTTVYSDVHQRKHQSSASLAFVRGIHRGPVNSPHKGPVTRKIFTFDDVIMILGLLRTFLTRIVLCDDMVQRDIYASPGLSEFVEDSMPHICTHCNTLCTIQNGCHFFRQNLKIVFLYDNPFNVIPISLIFVSN